MATIPEALAAAIEHHRGGRLSAAELIYRRILQAEPNQADAIHLLGLIAHQVGKHALAVEYIKRAISLDGTKHAFHNNLGETYRALRRFPEAVACYHRALSLKQDCAEVHNNLGLAMQDQEHLDNAVAYFKRALDLKPSFAQAHYNLGNAWKDQEHLENAVACYSQALALNSSYAEAHNNLGNVLKLQGKLGKAVACFRRAIELKPDLFQAHHNLGCALKDQGKFNDAIACYHRALDVNPGLAEAHFDLGNTLDDQGKLDEAVACYCHALELQPGHFKAQNNLGNKRKDQGNLDEAIACYRRALQLNPGFSEAHNNLCYALQFCPKRDARAVLEEHLRWNTQHVDCLSNPIQTHPNDRSPSRRLRIGYISPDFRDHVVGRNMWPLFRRHDHAHFEIYAYSQSPTSDHLTERFRGAADAWRDVFCLSDVALSQLIRQDRIDILVDLTLHMRGNRLLTFARKPAPVQVTFAGYPGTTGLSAIDYRLTDPYLDPPGLYDDHYTEESIRLADTFWCYDPITDGPEVSALPALEKGHVTFGCLNNFCKTNPAVFAVWSQVLRAVDGSRLLILAAEGTHRQRTLDLLEQEGIAAHRIAFVAHQPRLKYLRLYHDIDIGLDTFPYNGHTTSLDSLWMGVPVVTLVGATVVGRAGFSQLSNLGLPEFIAHSPEEFVAIAIEWANDLERLSQLRATLRERMRNSPLMDAPRFASSIEAAYREMWRRYCEF